MSKSQVIQRAIRLASPAFTRREERLWSQLETEWANALAASKWRVFYTRISNGEAIVMKLRSLYISQ